jgi:predicted ribosome quality control (RQC) complex YloA/Tae2 family protein
MPDRRAAAPKERPHEHEETAMKQLAAVNDFVVKFANVNGSGSASANELFARAIMRMGVPVSPRNIFPSNIQGLPTWYEVRVNEGRPPRPARRSGPHGRDEPADLGTTT